MINKEGQYERIPDTRWALRSPSGRKIRYPGLPSWVYDRPKVEGKDFWAHSNGAFFELLPNGDWFRYDGVNYDGESLDWEPYGVPTYETRSFSWEAQIRGAKVASSSESNDHDPVNHPRHYTSHPSGVECITITRHHDFAIGNAIKYLWRAGLKGSDDTELQDLRKAVFYINDKIVQLESKEKE
jgi:hypothetical protein